MPESDALSELLEAWAEYQRSRMVLLGAIGMSASNRDPLSEFSEVLVATLLNAEKAPNRVQKGYDLIAKDGARIEVKYLSNPVDSWVNWHVLKVRDTWERYALVYFEELLPKSIIIFNRDSIGQLYVDLKKRHKDPDSTLEITSNVYRELTTRPEAYTGVEVHLFDAQSMSGVTPT